jgi:hypothetical protein
VTTQWLRSLRRLTVVLVGVPVLVALFFTWRSAWRADVLGAAVGAGLTLGILGAGALMSAWQRLGMAIVRGQRRVERAERRLDALARVLETQATGLTVQQEELRAQADRVDRRVADLAKTDEQRAREAEQRLAGMDARIEAFCKLHDEQADRLDRRVSRLEAVAGRGTGPADAVRISESHWAADDSPPGERTVSAFEHLVAEPGGTVAGASHDAATSAERQRLRQEFASLIHQRDYAAALDKGDEIASRFPESSAAADFMRVRPHLVRKIRLLETAPAGGGK